MKKRYKAIITLILFMSFMSVYAGSQNAGIDPISNSYIINNLQMESDSNQYSESDERYSGEIIFDNSFTDSLMKPEKNINKLISGNGNIIKNLKKKDSRWHVVEYKVRKNDSVWKISKKFKADSSAIIALNNLSSKGVIRENEVILVPSKSGITYKIRMGDTLSSIAEKYATDIEKIADHNNIDGKKIYAGGSIFIPDASEIQSVVYAKKTNSHNKVPENTQVIASNRIEKKISEIKDDKLHLSWPLKGPITSGFGYRTHPFSKEKSFHCGLDIGAEIGTPVRSAGEGKVIFSGWKGAYGNLIVIQHKNNYITVYAHNSKLLVGVDENIRKGQKIALSGKTGAVTGAHLHFEIRKGIVPINPSRILR